MNLQQNGHMLGLTERTEDGPGKVAWVSAKAIIRVDESIHGFATVTLEIGGAVQVLPTEHTVKEVVNATARAARNA